MIRRELPGMIAIVGGMVYAFMFGYGVASMPTAKAAVPAAPTPISDNCVEVATVGLLEVYLCETLYGDLFVNSFGFMTPVN